MVSQMRRSKVSTYPEGLPLLRSWGIDQDEVSGILGLPHGAHLWARGISKLIFGLGSLFRASLARRTNGFAVPKPQASQQAGNFPVTTAAWEPSGVNAASRHAHPSV